MNNHLSHRWPDGPARPLFTLEPPAPKKEKKKRRGLRTLLIILICVILMAALVAGAYFGIIYAAERFAGSPSVSDKGQSIPSAPIPSVPSITWTPEDFPWGQPDPSTSISLSQAAPKALTPQEIYSAVLPAVVCVNAEHGDTYSVGSGVILTANGYIVTNYHVVEGGTALYVTLLSNEKEYEAKLIGYDEEFDIAVLKINATGLTPAVLADSDQLQVGDEVYAIGNPLGYLYGTMTDGIVSSLARQIDIDGNSMTLIQTSVPLNSGNSGGALVDSYGRVTGITVAKITGMSGDTVVEGIGLVIPITDMLPFINHIIHTGTSYRPNLGILCYEAEVGGQKGILVDSTTEGSPAEKLLFKSDLIIAANGIPVTKLHELTRILYRTGVGNEVVLTVLRGHKEFNIAITLYDRLAQ